MQTGWTGGQYSIYRAVLAASIALLLGERLASATLSGITGTLLVGGILGCCALAIGWHDRWVAAFVLVLSTTAAAFVDGAPLELPGIDIVFATVLLALHLATPPHPFGAVTAIGRPDPSGGWEMPFWIPHAAWGLLAVFHVVTDLERLSGLVFAPATIDVGSLAWLGVVFDLWFVVAVFRVRQRASAWIAMSLWKLAWIVAFGDFGGHESAMLGVLHLLAFDPLWLASTSRSLERRPDPDSAREARLFYDGECGLCHRAVRIVLAEDANMADALRLRFAPLQGDAWRDLLTRTPRLAEEPLPDSLVLELEDGRLLTQATAALEIADRLGGLWRAIGFLLSAGGWVPTTVLDRAYDFIATHRKRLFATPKESCPIMPPAVRERFDL